MSQLDSNEKVNYNYGLALLRIWMCFEVVMDHFKDWNGAAVESLSWPAQMICRYGPIAVPVFMLSAFIFTDIAALANDGERIKKRFYRLLIPHVFWALFYFAVYKMLDIFLGLGLENGIRDLFWQLLLGHSLNQTEWFQIDLIIITAVFILGFRIFKKNAVLFTVGMLFLALFLQYSCINGAMFDNVTWGDFNSSYVTYPIGRIMEMMPYAALGILACRYSLLNKIEDQSGTHQIRIKWLNLAISKRAGGGTDLWNTNTFILV